MIKHIYKQMLSDTEHNDRKTNWAILVKKLLSELVFMKFCSSKVLAIIVFS